MVLLHVPGQMISDTKVKKPTIFCYEPAKETRVGIWEHQGEYKVQVYGNSYVYTIATTQTPDLAYGMQKQAKQLLEKGKSVIITGPGTARIESLEEILEKIKTKQL